MIIIQLSGTKTWTYFEITRRLYAALLVIFFDETNYLLLGMMIIQSKYADICFVFISWCKKEENRKGIKRTRL